MKAFLIDLLDFFGLTAKAINLKAMLKYLFNFKLVAKNRNTRTRSKADSLPLPPPGLVFQTINSFDLEYYLSSGEIGSSSILAVLKKNWLELKNFKSVLDFGCGCGRIIRCWRNIKGPSFYGTDYNRRLIRWCGKNISFANFSVNGIGSGFEYNDGSFDFIYALSVFTHLDEKLQELWLSELDRILKPGGVLLITMHGMASIESLSKEEKNLFLSGRQVVRKSAFSGSNACAAFHPPEYVKENFTKKMFTLVDFVPGGAKDARQDIYLFRKAAV